MKINKKKNKKENKKYHHFAFSEIDNKYGLPVNSKQDVINFNKNKAIMDVIVEAVHTDMNIIENIISNRNNGKRSFVFGYVAANEKEPKLVAVNVVLAENIHKLPFVAEDKRFLEYIQKYDLEIMIPVYVKFDLGFQATIMFLPNTDPKKIKEALNL